MKKAPGKISFRRAFVVAAIITAFGSPVLWDYHRFRSAGSGENYWPPERGLKTWTRSDWKEGAMRKGGVRKVTIQLFQLLLAIFIIYAMFYVFPDKLWVSLLSLVYMFLIGRWKKAPRQGPTKFWPQMSTTDHKGKGRGCLKSVRWYMQLV